MVQKVKLPREMQTFRVRCLCVQSTFYPTPCYCAPQDEVDRRWLKYLDSCPLCGSPRWSLGILDSAWPNPHCCKCSRNEPTDKRVLFVLRFSLHLANKQTNKYIFLKIIAQTSGQVFFLIKGVDKQIVKPREGEGALCCGMPRNAKACGGHRNLVPSLPMWHFPLPAGGRKCVSLASLQWCPACPCGTSLCLPAGEGKCVSLASSLGAECLLG